MNIVLFDTQSRKKLFPLTLTRSVADLRMGILTIKERWEIMTGAAVFVLTDFYLQVLYEGPVPGEYIFIDACVIPNAQVLETIMKLGLNECIEDHGGLIAGRVFVHGIPPLKDVVSLFSKVCSGTTVRRLTYPFDLFQWNQEMIENDFSLITDGRISQKVNQSVDVSSPANIFIEDGASINYSILNASNGPIYIGKNAVIMEGCVIRGPFALCEGAVLKMGAKIYGATTIGPYSTGGGEIKNSILTGYSNKSHDGYLGDSVIGEWCNMGAGTSNSNVKNTGGVVSQWNYYHSEFMPAGQKCGVVMGDYSRIAINSSINTGSIIGICCNVFGNGLLPKLIGDFTWGSKPGIQYQFEKAIKDIGNWKKMKNKTVSEQETAVLKHIFELSNKEHL